MATKSAIQHILTPETEKHFFTDQILPTLLRGENVTILRLPHSGSKTQMAFLANYSQKLGFEKLGKYKIVHIIPFEVEDDTFEAYFSLMLYGLTPKGRALYNKTGSLFELRKKIIKNLSEGEHLIFILEEFNSLNYPKTFFDSLFGLWCLEKPKINFIFCVNNNIFNLELLKYGKLNEAIMQNKIYFPLLSISDSEVVIQRLSSRYGFSIPKPKKELIKNICGGQIGLIKECLRIANIEKTLNKEDFFNIVSQNHLIKLLLENIWASLSSLDQKSLYQIVTHQYNDSFKISDFLISLKVVVKKGSTYSLFSPLFSLFVKERQTEKQSLSFDTKTGEILINDFPVKEKITFHEYKLLAAFLEKPDTLLSRDVIADILWGSAAENKYSDWAIDQNISLLRKKLETIGISSRHLQTVKSRGYRWLP